jgi:hypothetical protein
VSGVAGFKAESAGIVGYFEKVISLSAHLS